MIQTQSDRFIRSLNSRCESGLISEIDDENYSMICECFIKQSDCTVPKARIFWKPRTILEVVADANEVLEQC